jgi:hypothetical protein
MRLRSDKWVFGDEQVPLKFRERGTGREIAGLVAVDSEGVPVDAADLEWSAGPGWRMGISSCVYRTTDTRQYDNQASDGGLLPVPGQPPVVGFAHRTGSKLSTP